MQYSSVLYIKNWKSYAIQILAFSYGVTSARLKLMSLNSPQWKRRSRQSLK